MHPAENDISGYDIQDQINMLEDLAYNLETMLAATYDRLDKAREQKQAVNQS